MIATCEAATYADAAVVFSIFLGFAVLLLAIGWTMK